MTLDIDENVKSRIIRLFDEDKKPVQKKTEDYIAMLQKDLDTIYKWANESLMDSLKVNFSKQATEKLKILILRHKKRAQKRKSNQVKQ